MDRPAVRIGFVGVGAMGQCAHLRNYLATPGCAVVALAELRPELGRRVAARYGVANVYRDHREMLAAEKLDAIVSIQHFSLHGRILPEILAAGLPTLIEKPLARSVEAGERIFASPNSDKLFVGYHKRSDPATLWALTQIARWKQSGEVGPMRYVRVTMPPGDWAACGFAHRVDTGEPIPATPADPPESAAYEAFVNYYIHQVNLIRLLLGESYRVTHADPILLVGRSDSGVTCALEMAPYRTTIDWQEAALVTFEKAWIRIDLPAPLAIDRAGRVTVFHDKGDGADEPRTFSPTLPPVHAMRRQAEQFVAAVRGEKTTLCRAHEALEDLRVARQYLELLERQPR
jgi:predicted dehydrogenase